MACLKDEFLYALEERLDDRNSGNSEKTHYIGHRYCGLSVSE